MNNRTFAFLVTQLKYRTYMCSDLTLQDVPSNILPSEAIMECKVKKMYNLKRSLISAAMDTVTEAQMAV